MAMGVKEAMNKKNLMGLVVSVLWAFFWFGASAAMAFGAQAESGHGKLLDWPVYGGQAGGDHYSSLSQINRTNVSQLRLAWKFDTGEKGVLQTSPIVIGHVLYAYTPTQKVLAIDAASGQLLWRFDS